MGLGDFWLQFNNGKKEQLNDTKHGVRKEQVDKKFHNLFDAYDLNNDGTLEENEVQTIFGHLKNFAGDNVLDSAENLKAKSVFAEQVNMQDVDFQGFVKSISDATSNIISSEETKTSDGGKEIKTEYKDGTTETIAYYSNGDFKWKKIEKKFQKTTYEMILDGKRQELTEEQYNQALKKLNEKPKQKTQPKTSFGLEGQQRVIFPQPTPSVEVKTTTNKWEEHKQEYSPRFIAEKLGVDINTDEGKKILERMSYLPKEALDQIKDGAELKDIIAQNDLPPNFDNISNVLELLYGVTLRNEEEFEASKPQREKIIQQIQTVGIMSELYARVAEFNDTYNDNQGVFGMGAEGIGYILNKVGIQGENHYQWADSCREFIKKINDFKVLNPEKFEQEFKELTGKDSFNIDALQKMVELSKNNKALDEEGNYTEEFKQAVKDFSDFDVSDPNAKAWYHPDNLLNGFGEALIMIATLGWGAETKAGQMLATSTMATFGKAGVTIASKQVNNRLLQGALRLSGKGVKLLAPMINEGTKMYAYTAVTGTASNIANRAIKFDSEENSLEKFLDTEAMVLDNAKGSFAFGAFAGAFGSTVTQKVMQRASRVSQKVGTALSDKFAKGAVDANEVFTTILEKSAPTKIAEVAAFATDVLGFTAFESVLAIVKNLDNFPNGYSVEDLTNIIWEELKSQGYNLGQIKIVAWLLSSRSARMQATRYMKDAMPQLRGASVEWVNEGKDGYKINLPGGRKIECKNTTEYISALQLMVRGETAFSSKFDITSKERFRLNCEKLGMSESEMADLEAYQQTAIDFVKKVQSENAKRAFSIRIKDGYSSELFPDIKESRAIKRNSKKMIQELEENPKLVELYRELERIQKAENERTGYDQDINRLHSHIQYILEHIDPKNAGAAIELARFIESKGTEHVTYLIEQNLQYANISKTDVVLKKAFYEAIKNDQDITDETRLELLQYLDENSCEYISAIYPYLKPEHKNKTSCSNAGDILYCKTKADADVKLEIFKKYGVDSFSILKDITAENGKTAKLILEDNTLSDTVRWAMFGNEEAMKKYQELKDDPDILDSDINTLLFGGRTSGCIELVKNSESIEVYKLFSKKEGFPKELIAGIAVECTEYTKELALMMSEMPDFPPEQIAPILREVKAKDDILIGSWNKEELTKLNQSVTSLLQSGKFPPEVIAPTVKVMTRENIDYSLDICSNWQKQELLPKQVPLMIYYKDHISTQQFRKLNRKLGADVVSKLAFDDIYLGAKFADIIDVKNINEIPLAGKKEFIRNLVDCNTGMFEISDDLKPHLPLLPTDNEQYCGLMRAAVKSLGIETNPLTPEQKITLFNHSMKNLSETMANLSDSEFAGLTIEQEFSREDFISVVREKTKGLSTVERQKVYDYYGFEIHHKKGRNQRKELTLTGYPVNLNNGQKLAEITDPNTKAVVESLREDVVRFSEKNPIKCNNKQIETFLNEVVEAMPEIRSMIGRKQHGTHDFDVMQHSLKVMQKIVQDPKFEQLNESDKKLMLLASLLHDITKAEGISDGTHASEGSFDAYYIAKKIKLSRDEELKLSDLIRHHEWLGNVNRDIRINTEGMKPEEAEKKKQEILTKRLQAVAFDMQNDNLFDMVMIFTHADLKAVKADDTFHDTREGNTRAVFDKNNNRVFDPIKQAKGVRKSHGEAADIYAERIREYIHELQKTRPLTPTTKVPTMSEIRTHITQINPDGSTNIKGVYVDTDGLIVIKVNDVENWEALGFPAGTTTKGILANVNNNGEEVHQVETGNFKIMAHGLDFPNQLAKFEAFSLPSSESMLSLTYMERPETKSRNFRPQGVGLDFDSKYIYGGGETDAGSGCGKTISDFKADYIFGGHREGDRKFVADIVKKATGMTDEEYIQFYEANKDKAWEEFDNQDIANALIVAYAEGIHSNVRYGERAYTEFYGSNPKRVNSTWVFSLDPEEKIGNPLEFLHRTDLTEGELNSADIGGRAPRSVADRTQFLREFSLNKDHDVPMFIFGDSSVEKVVNEGVNEGSKLDEKTNVVLENSVEEAVISEETKPQNSATTPGSSEIQTFAEISNDFAKNHKSYELYSDNDGNNVVMIVAVAGERPHAAAGIPFTYEVYRFDKDGNQIAEPLRGLSEKEAKKYQLENKQFVDKRVSDNSGTLNSFIIPLPKKIRELLFNDKKIKEESKSFESQIQELENNLAKRPNILMPKFLISKILEATNKDNIKLAEKLCKNSYVTSFDFIEILKATNKDNIELAERLSDKKTYSKFVTKDLKNLIPKILKVTNKDNINIAIELCFDKKVPKDKVADILLQKNKNITNEKIKKIEQQLSLDKEISQDEIANILKNINQDNIKLADMICSDRTFPIEEIAKILSVTNNENINTAIQLYLDKNVLPNQIAYKIMQSDSEEVRINRIMQIASGDFHHEATYMWCPELAEILCFDERFPKDKIGTVCQFSRSQDCIKEITEIVKSLCADKNFPRDYMANILQEINKYNLELFQQLYSDKGFPRDQIAGILYETRKNNIDTAKMLCSDKDFPKGKIGNIIANIKKDNLELFNQLYSDKEFPRDQIAGILSWTNHTNIDATKMLCSDKDFPRDKIENIIANIREDNFELFNQLYSDKEFPRDQIAGILRWTNDTNIEVFNTLYADKEFPKNLIVDILHKTKSYDSTTRKFNNPICIELFNKLYADKKFPRDKIAILLSGEGNSGNYLADKDVNSLDEAVKLQKANVIQYPEKYVNGKYSSVEGIQLAVNIFFEKQYCNLLLISEIFDKQTVNNFLRMRFEKATDYMKILQNFSNYELDLLKQLSNSTDIAGKPFLATQKIELIDLIEAYRVSKLSTSKIEEMIKTGKVDIAQLKKDIFAEILKRAGMTDDEIASIPNEKITAWDVKYAHFLSKEVQDNHDSAFDDIIRVANLDDFNRYIHDTDNI